MKVYLSFGGAEAPVGAALRAVRGHLGDASLPSNGYSSIETALALLFSRGSRDQRNRIVLVIVLVLVRPGSREACDDVAEYPHRGSRANVADSIQTQSCVSAEARSASSASRFMSRHGKKYTAYTTA
jgi:hypothetical protein